MKNIILTIMAVLLFSAGVFAQSSIAGRVTDANGKGVAGIVLTAKGNGHQLTATTDEKGDYVFGELEVGMYSVTTKETTKFQSAVREEVSVVEDEPAKLNIQLVAAIQKPAPTPPAQPAVPARGTVDEIIDQHIAAIGGRDLIAKIQTIYMETNSQIMGNDAPGTVTILNGKGYRAETQFNGAKMIQCYSDKGGWATNPMSGNTPEAMPDVQYKSGRSQIQVGGELFDYAAKGSKVELLGKDGNLYKIKLTSKDAAVSIYYIDPATYFITKLTKTGEAMGQEVEITIYLSDYRKTDYGFTMAYSTQLDFGSMFSMTNSVRKVEINKPVDPKIFEIPK